MEQLYCAFLDLQKDCLDTDPRQGRARGMQPRVLVKGVCVCVESRWQEFCLGQLPQL